MVCVMSEDLVQYLGNAFLDFLKGRFVGMLEKLIKLGIKRLKIATFKKQIIKQLKKHFTSQYMRTSEDFKRFLMNLIDIESFEGTTRKDLKEKLDKKLNLILEDHILKDLIEETKKILKSDTSDLLMKYYEEKFNIDFCYNLFRVEKRNKSNSKIIEIIQRSIFQSIIQFLNDKSKDDEILYQIIKIKESLSKTDSLDSKLANDIINLNSSFPFNDKFGYSEQIIMRCYQLYQLGEHPIKKKSLKSYIRQKKNASKEISSSGFSSNIKNLTDYQYLQEIQEKVYIITERGMIFAIIKILQSEPQDLNRRMLLKFIGQIKNILDKKDDFLAIHAHPIYTTINKKSHKSQDRIEIIEPLDEDYQEKLKDYLHNLILKYESVPWFDRAIKLKCFVEGGQLNSNNLLDSEDLSTFLNDWVNTDTNNITFMLGEFGSGKTWALYKFARDLAKSCIENNLKGTIPIIISLPELFTKTYKETDEIQQEWDSILKYSRENRDFTFIFDGLDEIIFIQQEEVINFLKKIAMQIPQNSRLLISCRTQAFELDTNIKNFYLHIIKMAKEDRTDLAVQYALWGPKVLKLNDLKEEDKDQYLLSGPAANYWVQYKNEPMLQYLSNKPFMVYLLESALPVLSKKHNVITLPGIYKLAIKTWIMRDKFCLELENSPDCLIRFLKDMSIELLSFQNIDYGISFEGLKNAPAYIKALINANLLKENLKNQINFTHQSFWEYFLALCLKDELKEMDAGTLANLNLIYSYTINRFLIPLLNERAGKSNQAGENLNKLIRSSLIEKDDYFIMSHPVNIEQYRLFVKESGWRKNIGHGIWLRMKGRDGILPVKGESPKNISIEGNFLSNTPKIKKNGPITGISWYDAYQFCNWVGGKLPSLEELKCIKQDTNKDILSNEWCRDWYSESESLITTFGYSINNNRETILGVNPDVRADNLGYRVIINKK